MRQHSYRFIFLAMFLLTGCGSNNGTGQKKGKNDGTVRKKTSSDGKGDNDVPRRPFRLGLTVSRDSEALRTARLLVTMKRSEFAAGLLAKLGKIHYFEQATIESAKEVKDLTLELKERLSAEVPVRLEAAVLLARLSDPQGLKGLFDLLQDGKQPAEIHRRVLQQIVELPAGLVLENKAHQKLLIERLSHANPQVQVDAIEACGTLRVAAATEHFARILASKKAAMPGRLAHWLAQARPNEATLKLAERWLLDLKFKGRRFWLAEAVQLIGVSAKANKPGTTVKAVDLLHRYLQQVEKKKLPIEETQVKDICRFLGLHGNERSLPLLLRVFKQIQPVPVEARGPALHAWIQVSHRAGAKSSDLIAKIELSLADPQLRVSAAAALAGLLGDKEPTDKLVVQLHESADASDDVAHREAIADALSRMQGAAAKAASLQLAKRLGPSANMRIHWIANGIKLEDAVAELVKRKLLPSRTYEDTITAVRKKLKINGNDADGFYEVIKQANAMVMFYRVVDDHPCGHDRLIGHFAKITNNAFSPSAILEQLDETGEEDEYRLQFISQDRLYQFRARVLDELYDVESIVAAMNRAYSDSGGKQRFVSVSTDEQVGTFLFGDPAMIREASEILHFPIQEKLDSDLEAARLMKEAIKKQSK